MELRYSATGKHAQWYFNYHRNLNSMKTIPWRTGTMIQPGGRMKIPVAWKPATQGPGIIPIYSIQRYHGTQAARETIYNVQ
jgi:hypothetical protein